ncbi:N-formylglutamate amidohydrolase [Parasedimentitalea huanghaiensis]|uniref:N-formylglutamate amidohydrolase n=1 Tax=Parasedimentitalea huanghaiensis TaxID=2682100 RepID=A0A6L6WIA9_9RHOB|nr:N-formylglutamate amidohydrolase [Zongyanglinia huanghaiensis]MVO16335.1 N-formylglutamate amidohydrolase [Zongyanglinia huanghaiensis]
MPKAVFNVFSPKKLRSGVVFASPHSGADYSQSFLSRTILNRHQIRSSEDAFVDQLFASAPTFGVPFLTALAPRAFVDLNRAADELDPALVDGAKQKRQNPRVASGLGVIPRVVAHGQAIYHGKLSQSEVQNRIDRYWHPYHKALQELLRQAQTQFGQAILVDCHSMPHEAVEAMGHCGGQKPEVVLGDRFGAAASAEVMDRIEEAFIGAGLTVSRNAPFAGAYITQAYGRPSRRQHAVQVEIDRALYMNEDKIEPNGNFAALKALLDSVIAEIAKINGEQLPLAAE